MAYSFESSEFGEERNDKLTVELTNGITGKVNAFIDLKVGGKLHYSTNGKTYDIECVEVTHNYNRQCYCCFFCHNIEGCGTMRCNPDSRADRKYVKFRIIK